MPVRVVPGFPTPFHNVFEGIPPAVWRFWLRLSAIEATVKALDSVIDVYSGIRSDAIPDQVPRLLPPSVADAKEFGDHLLFALQKIEIGQRLGGISEDILGTYFECLIVPWAPPPTGSSRGGRAQQCGRSRCSRDTSVRSECKND